MQDICCPVCKHTQIKDIRLHFYTYYQCEKCQHVFSALKKQGVRSCIRKFQKQLRQTNNEIIQDALTENYFNELKKRDDFKETLIPFFVGNTILDTSAETGSFVEKIRNLGYDAHGIEHDRIFEPYWHNKSWLKIGTIETVKRYERFDTIIIPNILPYVYCVYQYILECYTRINPNGCIVASVPINNNPKKNYLSRAHEFSEKSMRFFAQECHPKTEITVQENTAIVIFPN